MYTAILVIFLLGYLAIALEHNIGIDKAASALITGVLCWAVYTLGAPELTEITTIPPYIQEEVRSFTDSPVELVIHYVTHYQILEHLGEIASILFFLLGAMTIVELVDAHEGFSVITRRIHTTQRRKLLWIIAVLTFFLSAALDNLTTSIVMISLLKKLIETRRERWLYAGVVIISANAGGAWSPIGDVTTTMLWIGTQVTAGGIITKLILPSLVCMLVPVAYLSTRLHGHVKRPLAHRGMESYVNPTTPHQRKIVLISGLGGLLLVPIFKSYTHLPPFMGMMLSLGLLWIITELLHRAKNLEKKSELTVVSILRRVDASTVLFFLGILLAVAALDSAGHLADMSSLLEGSIGTREASGIYGIGLIIGMLSAVIDNVPLVAASMGMYEIVPTAGHFFSQDGLFWEFLAYCAGTGGSALIIGSAAGVAVMGLEGISFGWYVRKVSLLALLGYLSGAVVYILQESLLHL